jgi:hypothetical protein
LAFASSFYRDPDAVTNDLVEMLARLGIEPVRAERPDQPLNRFTEHRIERPPAANQHDIVIPEPTPGAEAFNARAPPSPPLPPAHCIALGDKVVLLFSNQKRVSARLVEGANDLEKRRLSVTSPLGLAILGAEEGKPTPLPVAAANTTLAAE